jgi:hypothetical protein
MLPFVYSNKISLAKSDHTKRLQHIELNSATTTQLVKDSDLKMLLTELMFEFLIHDFI